MEPKSKMSNINMYTKNNEISGWRNINFSLLKNANYNKSSHLFFEVWLNIFVYIFASNLYLHKDTFKKLNYF